MTKEYIVQSIIDELTINGVCLIFNPHIFGEYMERIYTAGYEAANKSYSNQKGVIQMDMDGKLLKVYESIASASRQVGVHKGNIAHCCRGEHASCGGYKWKYAEKND